MNIDKIEDKLNNIFNQSSDRKIVMWYDSDKEFEEDIDNIKLENAELYKLKTNNWIYTEYYIEYENPDINYLIYAPFEKPSDEVNYLADMVHYATLFSADKIDIVADELDIPSEYKEVLKLYPKFWNANSRLNSFKELNISNINKVSIELGILAVLSNVKNPHIEIILRKVIVENDDENNRIIDNFKKFNILDTFWSFIYKKYDFLDDVPTVNNLIKFLILNYTADLFDGSIPKPWKYLIVDNRNNIRVFIDDFMNNVNYIDCYDSIVKDKESKWNIANAIKNYNIESYIKCDSFEVFDKKIIQHCLDLLYNNKESLDLDEILKIREKTHFYKKYENEYNLLKWTNSFIYLINEFQREDLLKDAEELIDLFVNKFVEIDKSYRKFYFYYDKIENIDKIEDLRQLIENMYNNTFLSKLNYNFTSVAKNFNEINIPKQWNFYKQNVIPSVNKHKTVVIISDAFRYGCALELKEELDKDPTRKTSLQPMLSTLPSYTALGMVSLLPHKEIEYDEQGNVLVDGKSAKSTEDREKILKSYNKNAIALQYDYINLLKNIELKDLLKGKDLIYIYHNEIDARGDNSSTENEVFDAAQKAIKELNKLITKLTNAASISNIYITADHGFIYKRDKLKESSKVDLNNIPAFYKNKRFLLSKEKYDIPGTISIHLDYIKNDNIYVTVPKSTDIFKAPGNGLNYVHGGLSLEESIIPLMNVNTKKGSKNQDYVELQLLSPNRKIVNYDVILTFYQKENISNTILPLKASAYFVDEENHKISNEIIINANINSNSAEDREFKEKFTLIKGDYSKTKSYYLIIKNIEEDIEIDRFEFTIDIIFQDDFTFF